MSVKSSSQVTLIDITDAYSVILTSESYVFTGDKEGALIGSSCNTQVVAYCGTTPCTKINITASKIVCPSGISATVTNNATVSPTVTFRTTKVITDSCEATIPVVVDGVTINKKFTFSVAKTGSDGSDNVEVGGRNLIPNTKTMIGYTRSPDVELNTDKEGYGVATCPKKSTLAYVALSSTKNNIKYSLIRNKTVTISFEYRSDSWTPSSSVDTGGYDYPILGLYITNVSETSDAYDRYHSIYDSKIARPTTDWQKYVRAIDITDDFFEKGAGSEITEESWFYVKIFNYSLNMLQIRKIKMEVGNVSSDWSPAPEDMATSDQVSETKTQLDILNNMISSLVTDGNGSSLMTQTGDGWTFNIGEITNQINKATKSLSDLTGNVEQVNNIVNNVNGIVNDVIKKTAYITLATDSSGNPCIELGKEGNPFKVRITNTSIDFIDNNVIVAYVNNNSLYIESAVIKNELKIGDGSGYVWKRRSNGNLGLRYSG